MRLAVGHLLSWESWSILAAKEHQDREQNILSFREKFENDDLKCTVESLRVYEQERLELRILSKELGEASDRFRINKKMLRCWTDLREKWIKASDQSPSKLMEISAEIQTKKQDRFGDPHLFEWLSRSENHSIWKAEFKIDAVTYLASLNALEAIVERSKETASMTLPDPIAHPRTAQWEPVGGANLKNYKLTFSEDKSLQVEMPLLVTVDDGMEEVPLTYKLAPSKQSKGIILPKKEKKTKQQVHYIQSSGETTTAELGSTDLLLDWSYLRNRSSDRVRNGDIGPAYLKVAIDIDPMVPEGVAAINPRARFHFLSANTKSKTPHQEHVKAGMRVLSVDLGLRSFASCSVF